MNYIPIEKINLHAKLGRNLYQFIKIGEYFESRTFEWAQLSKTGELYKIELKQGLDYEYSITHSMEEFETVDDLENENKSFSSETLEECFIWSKNNYGCLPNKWSKDIIEIYNNYVKNEVLGHGRDYE